VKPRREIEIGRRDLLRVLAAGAAAASTSVSTSARAGNFPDKRKARYKADSSNVQNFYRVNGTSPLLSGCKMPVERN
jgi:hypothetical protein